MRRWQQVLGLLTTMAILAAYCVGSSHSLAFDTRMWKTLARPGVPVTNRDHWPKGLHAFLNLPERGIGGARATNFEPFSEYYRYTVRDLEHVQALIVRFAEIESDGLIIVLSVPGEGDPEPVLGATLEMDEYLKRQPPTLLIALPKASDADMLDLPKKITVKRQVHQKRVGGDIVTIF